jgi:hypothetical protein
MTTDFQCWDNALAATAARPSHQPCPSKAGKPTINGVRPGVLTDAYVLDYHMISGGDSL